MKVPNLMLSSLTACLLLLPALAFGASSNNRVFIKKDASGADQSINITITDAGDVATLKNAFEPGLTLADSSQSFSIDCTAGDACLVSFHEDGAIYRQRYDELIKGFDLSVASAAAMFGDKWNSDVLQESCDADNCSHFEVKRFRDADGKFMLQCNARITTAGERLAPNCFMRIDITDVVTEEGRGH